VDIAGIGTSGNFGEAEDVEGCDCGSPIRTESTPTWTVHGGVEPISFGGSEPMAGTDGSQYVEGEIGGGEALGAYGGAGVNGFVGINLPTVGCEISTALSPVIQQINDTVYNGIYGMYPH
jgi:hypothetical protein